MRTAAVTIATTTRSITRRRGVSISIGKNGILILIGKSDFFVSGGRDCVSISMSMVNCTELVWFLSTITDWDAVSFCHVTVTECFPSDAVVVKVPSWRVFPFLTLSMYTFARGRGFPC